ncbi:TetR/AcrR family transcriptional regulator C-terminal domain-containing protein [Curtobacterium sp. VKM Ac-2887]|uniref:TetR/AcrR family transcriptional regulator C-terminal domain-containing protein n=1 Tax=Curtobacterium sp. VKM Ac-2887 TaxID=2783819 RepID=UPI00188CDB46|nr:TetR/AcrR family transcriptional regulator C-terminal domain-containing protein [Curtobacterium sp. VKM Ac-2887]MBF4585698.1 TetR/AcrR family transcriptional regulator C-terminal domain-containing protein [Curtobacterium sp. VKM Ac-2887]
MPKPNGNAPTRKQGRPRRVDRSQIIAVAKSLDPSRLTMQAIADELGVDRKTINYHVTDRDGLLRLVASDVFESHFQAAFRGEHGSREPGTELPWTEMTRRWAIAVRDSVVVSGTPTHYYRIGGADTAMFEPVEEVLQSMLRAGFDRLTASRGLVFLTRFAMGVGRDIVMESSIGEHPQSPEVRRAFEADDSDRFEAFRWMMDNDLNGPSDIEEQFLFELDVYMAGMAKRLAPIV